jgi:hypothetical protein
VEEIDCLLGELSEGLLLEFTAGGEEGGKFSEVVDDFLLLPEPSNFSTIPFELEAEVEFPRNISKNVLIPTTPHLSPVPASCVNVLLVVLFLELVAGLTTFGSPLTVFFSVSSKACGVSHSLGMHFCRKGMHVVT